VLPKTHHQSFSNYFSYSLSTHFVNREWEEKPWLINTAAEQAGVPAAEAAAEKPSAPTRERSGKPSEKPSGEALGKPAAGVPAAAEEAGTQEVSRKAPREGPY
jgi:hypothetical protein